MNVLNKLKQEGKINYIGISLKKPHDAMTIINKNAVDVLEIEYNLFNVWFNKEVIPHARKKNIGLIVKSPLNKGVLTAKYNHESIFDSNDSRSQYLNRETLKRRNTWIDIFCKKFKVKRKEMKEFSLRFVFSNIDISVVALGMRNCLQLEDNLSVFEKPFFKKEKIEKIEEFSISHYHILGGKTWNQ